MKLKTISCILAASLLIVGCSKDKEPEEDKPVHKKVEVKEETKYTYPLTGQSTEGEVNKRPVAVMINNHPKARPQSGLQKADIVYEMLAEGDVTRFLAVYQSEEPERVGPVRSARDYFIELAKGLNSIYICHGYSPDAKQLLDAGYIDNLNGLFYDGTLFKRDNSRKAPHNSYITFANIEKGAEEQSFNLEEQPKGFAFLSEKEEKSLEGEAATNVTVKYGSHSFDVMYKYDEGKMQYTRYSDGVQTVDKDTDEPVLLSNIIILEAPHKIIDSQGRRDIDFSAGGNAYLLQEGKWNTIQWQFNNNVITFVKDGKEAKLVPGKTWVNVVPDKPGLESNVTFQ
ncbi:DUF3048 domain-containing protein [Bacillus massiliigorillae]|uniref:DUF3048 domain-containing protein n=1 Tax=Bacillus massiliigorillae TaxID=1243664 RepID=UPI00039A7536|nr:DUF3048 domain-containing protein [Bacillus massiliigorillae]